MGWRARGAAALVAVAVAVACSPGDPDRLARPPGDGAGPSASAGGAGVSSTGGDGGATTTTEPPVTVTLAFAGDLLSHSPVTRQAAAYGAASGAAYDYRPMLARVAPVLSAADLAVCHLETPLSPDGSGLSSYPVFVVPGELAAGAAASGFDACTVASNHALDAGPDGVGPTLDVLDTAGLRHAGTARTPQEAGPTLLDVGGVTVGLLNYTYGLNGFSLPDDRPWLVNVIDPERILLDAHAARAAGADAVVVALHWGEQYRTEPTADQDALARRLLASPDVDLIVGTHAHVVQPVEQIDGEYVLYGLGNFLSNQSPSCCAPGAQDGVIATVELAVPDGGPARATGVVVTPTWVDRTDYTVVPVAAAIDDPATPGWLRAELEASWQRTVHALGLRAPPGLLASDYPGPG